MNFQNSRFMIRLAGEGDAEGIKRVFESGEFRGGMSIQFLRGDDPVKSLQNDGERAIIPIAVDTKTGEIIGVGACVIRPAYVNGEVKRTGYLTGLKLLPDYQKRLTLIPAAYEFLYNATKDDVDVFYTTILSDNTEAQRLLEKKRSFMPEYRHVSDYTVYCMRTGKKCRDTRGIEIVSGHTAGINEFYAKHLPDMSLTPSDRHLFSLSDGDFYALKKNGEIMMACAVYNQLEYKQYLMKGYSGAYRFISGLPTKLLGYPPFPRAGSLVNYASIALFCCDDTADDKLILQFIRKVTQKSEKYDMLFWGLDDGSRYNVIFNTLRHVKYRSRAYEVIWEGRYPVLKSPLNLEVSLL